MMQKYFLRLWSLALILLLVLTPALAAAQAEEATDENGGYSLRFYGNGTGDIDRVKFRVDDPDSALNIGGDFTIEFFLKAIPGENPSGSCNRGDAGWIFGNIIIDRDIFGPGDYGDFGISLYGDGGVIAFGVSRGEAGETLCGETDVADGEWHHIAVTRDAQSGVIQLFVNGVLDATASAPAGDVSYRVGRRADWPNDPYLVIGAEKHDYDTTTYPSFSGWFDELRISDIVRYTEDFEPPTEAFTTDDNTLGLYHFDEGEGDDILDSSGTDSHGVRSFGGTPAGPEWSDDTPFSAMTDDQAG
jgi:hypothetical protein